MSQKQSDIRNLFAFKTKENNETSTPTLKKKKFNIDDVLNKDNFEQEIIKIEFEKMTIKKEKIEETSSRKLKRKHESMVEDDKEEPNKFMNNNQNQANKKNENLPMENDLNIKSQEEIKEEKKSNIEEKKNAHGNAKPSIFLLY